MAGNFASVHGLLPEGLVLDLLCASTKGFQFVFVFCFFFFFFIAIVIFLG